MANAITPRDKDYSQWYIDVVMQAKLADYAPVKGCMVIRPRGYALWEKMQGILDQLFKDTGVQNAYFPMMIPMSFLEKEKDHVEGFSPEVAVVTHAGGEKLEEPYALRPTSETMIWSMYKRWIQSWRDLPLALNQWANVVRWEKRTRLFLRTTEFLWQEGHTAHASDAEAQERTLQMLEVYRRFAEDYMAMPVLVGLKTDSEKFAGALRTYSIEAMMQDKKALQAGTSHHLGQNFGKAFDVQYQSKEGKLEDVWATSWGVSTRLVGALIMTHSDDRGLVIPPRLASTHIVIVPIFKTANKDKVLGYASQLQKRLQAKHWQVLLDDDDQNSPGWKFAEYELAGIPVRIEVGERDIDAGQMVVVRRDILVKTNVADTDIENHVAHTLDAMQRDMYDRALAHQQMHTKEISQFAQLQEYFNEQGGGFAKALWCGHADCEAKVKESTKATIRNLPFIYNETQPQGHCVVCGQSAQHCAIWSRSY
jgi:prolyl-tRNA synthetase